MPSAVSLVLAAASACTLIAINQCQNYLATENRHTLNEKLANCELDIEKHSVRPLFGAVTSGGGGLMTCAARRIAQQGQITHPRKGGIAHHGDLRSEQLEHLALVSKLLQVPKRAQEDADHASELGSVRGVQGEGTQRHLPDIDRAATWPPCRYC
jgi:hypothetical protein